MHIKTITLQNITTHAHSVITLPESGIMLITGDNGSGKSSILEGVSTAIWNKTLRGTSPWLDDKQCSISVTTDEFGVIRSRSKSGNLKLEWESNKYTTATKSQEALEKIAGSFNAWSKTAIFSTQDATHFTLATDKERKQLIESLVCDIDFDKAVEACRKDLREKRTELSRLVNQISTQQATIDGTERVCDSLEASIKTNENIIKNNETVDNQTIEDLKTKQLKTKKRLKQTRAERDEVREEESNIKESIRSIRAERETAEENLTRIDRDECPTCGQKIPLELREGFSEKLEEAKKEETSIIERLGVESLVRKTLGEDLTDLNLYIQELRSNELKLEGQIAALEQKQCDCWNAEDDLKRLKDEYTKQSKLLVNQENKLEEFENQKEKLEIEIDELEAVEKILGVEGFRAHIIDEVLNGIEAIANTWLARLSKQKFFIELLPYSELKKGGVRDKISLLVHGIGGGYHYKGASAGERRRIDVSILLANNEISAGAQGIIPGTMFIDEIADGLDGYGRSAIAEAFQELSRERCVVVISHDEKLAQALKPLIHLHVVDGKIYEVNAS